MRILMLRSNPVRPDSRVEKEAYSLQKAGHEVHIVCWDRDSTHKAEEEMITVAGETVPIVRMGYKAGFGLGMKALVPFSRFQLSLFRWLCKHRKSYDAIHACDFDTAFTASWAARLFHKKFVFDIFDFLGEVHEGQRLGLLERLEYQLIRFADATIICSEDRTRQIAGSHPNYLAVIHNTPFKEQLQSSGHPFHMQGNGDKIKVAYVGILQDYRLLLEIGHFFEQNPDIEWHVGGFGKYEGYFQQLSARTENVKFYGRISYDETLKLESECDIMLAIYDPDLSNHRFAAPNKFYESLMIGKPVLMVKGTGMSGIVAENDIGALIDFSEESFGEGLRTLIDREAEWPHMTETMQQLYNTKYSWDIMAKELLKLYDSIEQAQ